VPCKFPLNKKPPIKKPPRGYIYDPLRGFVAAIYLNPFSWLSPRVSLFIKSRIEIY
jgi:hypothetical protein